MSTNTTKVQKRRLNFPLLILVILAIAGVTGGIYGVRTYQIHQGARAWLNEATRLSEDKKPALALTYVAKFLENDPRNPEALDLQAKLMFDSARSYDDLAQALKAHETSILAAPEDPSRQDTRRRAIRLNLKFGLNETALGHARQLISHGADDADAYGLLGAALEVTTKVRGPAELAEAVKAYETAHRLDPSNPNVAGQLAALYTDVLGDPNKAGLVLDALLSASEKDPVAAHLVRHHYYAGHKDRERARNELDRAIALKPNDRTIRITAAVEALDTRDLANARKHLNAVPKDDQKDNLYLYVLGRLNYETGDSAAALTNWRDALKLTNGTDANTAFQLALALLGMGRMADAMPIIETHRRLTWDARNGKISLPTRFLQAVAELRLNRPLKAIEILEDARIVAPEEIQYQINSTLAQAHEQVGNKTQALEAFRRAQRADASRPEAWLSEARLLVTEQAAEAIDVLERGLEANPGQPKLLVALADLLRNQQRKLPTNAKIREAMDKATQAAQNQASDTAGWNLVQAERLAAEGKLEDARKLMEQATTRFPADLKLWTTRASILMRSGKADEASKILAQAGGPKAAGDSAEIRAVRAQIYARQGQTVQARRILTSGADKLAIQEQALIWRALADLEASEFGDLAAAREAAAKWRELAPDDLQVHYKLLELSLAARDIEAAAAITRDIEHIDGNGLYGKLADIWGLLLSQDSDPNATNAGPETNTNVTTNQSANVSAKTDVADDKAASNANAAGGPTVNQRIVKRLREALEILTAVVAAHPEQPLGHHLKGQVQEKLGLPNDAVTSYRAALQHRGSTLVLTRLAGVLARTGRTEELDDLAREYPESAGLIERMAAESAAIGNDVERAKTKAAAAVAAAPGNPALRLWQAQLLTNIGDSKGAELVLKELVDQRRTEPGPWLALLQFQAGRKDPAAAATIEALLKEVKTDSKDLLEAQCRVITGDKDRAQAGYLAALRARPDDEVVVQEVVKFFESNQRPEICENALRGLIGRQRQAGKTPAHWAIQRLALLLSAKTFDDAAWQEAYRLVLDDAKVSDTANDRMIRAQVLMRGARPQNRREAEAILDGLVTSSPNDVNIRALLAQFYFDENRLDSALKHAQIVARSGRPSGLAFYCRLLIQKSLLDEAERELSRLQSLEPRSVRVSELRARLWYAQGKKTEAAALIDQAFREIRANAAIPGNATIAKALVTVMAQMGTPEQTEGLARSCSTVWPGTTPELVKVLGDLGRLTPAMEICLAAAPKAPPVGLAGLARAAVGIATLPNSTPVIVAQAEKLLDDARKANPNSLELTLAQAYLKHHQRKYVEEVAIYESVLKRPDGTKDLRFLNNMAWTLSENLNKPEDGLKRIEQALKAIGWHTQLLDTRGVILTRLKQYDRAIEDLEEVKYAEASPQVLYHLARARYYSRNMPAFRENLELAQKAGLTPALLQPEEREEFQRLSNAVQATRTE